MGLPQVLPDVEKFFGQILSRSGDICAYCSQKAARNLRLSDVARIDTRLNPTEISPMTAVAMLELKQQVSRLTKSELHELYVYMVSLHHKAQRPKSVQVKMLRDPATGLPYFAPRQGTPRLTFTKVKRILRDSP